MHGVKTLNFQILYVEKYKIYSTPLVKPVETWILEIYYSKITWIEDHLHDGLIPFTISQGISKPTRTPVNKKTCNLCMEKDLLN